MRCCSPPRTRCRRDASANSPGPHSGAGMRKQGLCFLLITAAAAAGLCLAAGGPRSSGEADERTAVGPALARPAQALAAEPLVATSAATPAIQREEIGGSIRGRTLCHGGLALAGVAVHCSAGAVARSEAGGEFTLRGL